jgi:hypothetical protein
VTNVVHFGFGCGGRDDTERRSDCKQKSLERGHFGIIAFTNTDTANASLLSA